MPKKEKKDKKPKKIVKNEPKYYVEIKPVIISFD